ncbi:hypothetical protein BT69DRAFT_399607 [Atractiella rhizophila]|nr:hypothetical protein BT69DRAFT_399607 [Atractiella rhizophila]
MQTAINCVLWSIGAKLPTLSSQQAQTLSTLRLFYRPNLRFDISQIIFDKPLNLFDCSILGSVQLDGGHENSNILPNTIFYQLMTRTTVFHLDFRFCTVNFSDFLTCIPYFHQREGGLRIYLTPFFGDWTEENSQKLQNVTKHRRIGFKLHSNVGRDGESSESFRLYDNDDCMGEQAFMWRFELGHP